MASLQKLDALSDIFNAYVVCTSSNEPLPLGHQDYSIVTVPAMHADFQSKSNCTKKYVGLSI
jgi:hypothetical protein